MSITRDQDSSHVSTSFLTRLGRRYNDCCFHSSWISSCSPIGRGPYSTSAQDCSNPQLRWASWLGKWKLHFPTDYRTVKAPGRDGKPGPTEPTRIELSLFDLEQDHGETTNLAAKHSEVVKKLQALADEFRKDLGDSGRKMEGSGVRGPGMVKE